MNKKRLTPSGAGGGCWLGGPRTQTSDNYNKEAKRMAEANLHGTDLFGEAIEKKHTSKLGDEFLIPPFSVLSAREGWWQERKRAWLSLGIQSELGRGEQLIPNGGLASKSRYDNGGGKGPDVGQSPGDNGEGPQLLPQARGRELAAPGGSKMPAANYSKTKARGDGRGRAITDS